MYKSWIILSLIFISLPGQNPLIEEAQQQFEAERYAACIGTYQQALKAYPEQKSTIRYNMAQVYRLMDSTDLALQYYALASGGGKNPEIASKASNNSGLLLLNRKQTQAALNAFKDAMRQDPANTEARHNYELLAIRIQQAAKQKQNQPQQPSLSDLINEELQEDNEDPEQKERDERLLKHLKRRWKHYPKVSTENVPQRRKSKPLSMEQARQLLDGMRENELNYLQQLRKSPSESDQKDGKPTW